MVHMLRKIIIHSIALSIYNTASILFHDKFERRQQQQQNRNKMANFLLISKHDESDST